MMCAGLWGITHPDLPMNALHAVREPVVVTFSVPAGLGGAATRRLIDGWYEAIGGYDFVYLGGTSFALNPPCPSAEALRDRLGEAVEVEALSRVLLRIAATPPLEAVAA